MKDYNEMAKAVFERRDEYVAARKKQRATLLKAGVTLCSVVLVCLVGLTLWLGGLRGPAKAPAPPVQPPTKNTEVTVIPENTDETQNVQQTVTEPVRIPADVDPTEPSKNTSGDSVSDGHPDVVPPNIDATSAEDPTEPQAPTVVPDDTEPEDVVKPTLPMEGTEPVATEPCIPPTRPLLPDSPPKPTVATEPTVEVTPTDPTEDLTEPPFTGELTINVGGKQYVAQVGDMVTYTAELYVKDYFETFQAGVLYDSQLEVVEVVNDEEDDSAPVHYPNITGGSELMNYHRDKSTKAEKQIFVTGSRLSGYRFKEQKVLFTFDFIVKKPGETKIVLDIEELVAKGGEPSYFTGGKQIVSEGINIEEYLSVTPADEVVIPTAPKDEEILETIPPFTYPEESYDGDTLILCDGRIYGADVGQRVTYVVELEAEEKFEGIETMVKFGDGLEAYEPMETDDLDKATITMPNLKGALVAFNVPHVENDITIPVVRFSASTHYKYDFRRRKVLLQVDFIVSKPGVYNIDLAISEMSIDGVRSYFVRGEQVVSDGIEIYEYVIVN